MILSNKDDIDAYAVNLKEFLSNCEVGDIVHNRRGIKIVYAPNHEKSNNIGLLKIDMRNYYRINKDWLRKQHFELNRTTENIGEECAVNSSTISYHLYSSYGDIPEFLESIEITPEEIVDYIEYHTKLGCSLDNINLDEWRDHIEASERMELWHENKKTYLRMKLKRCERKELIKKLQRILDKMDDFQIGLYEERFFCAYYFDHYKRWNNPLLKISDNFGLDYRIVKNIRYRNDSVFSDAFFSKEFRLGRWVGYRPNRDLNHEVYPCLPDCEFFHKHQKFDRNQNEWVEAEHNFCGKHAKGVIINRDILKQLISALKWRNPLESSYEQILNELKNSKMELFREIEDIKNNMGRIIEKCNRLKS